MTYTVIQLNRIAHECWRNHRCTYADCDPRFLACIEYAINCLNKNNLWIRSEFHTLAALDCARDYIFRYFDQYNTKSETKRYDPSKRWISAVIHCGKYGVRDYLKLHVDAIKLDECCIPWVDDGIAATYEDGWLVRHVVSCFDGEITQTKERIR